MFTSKKIVHLLSTCSQISSIYSVVPLRFFPFQLKPLPTTPTSTYHTERTTNSPRASPYPDSENQRHTLTEVKMSDVNDTLIASQAKASQEEEHKKAAKKRKGEDPDKKGDDPDKKGQKKRKASGPRYLKCLCVCNAALPTNCKISFGKYRPDIDQY